METGLINSKTFLRKKTDNIGHITGETYKYYVTEVGINQNNSMSAMMFLMYLRIQMEQ